MRGETEGNGGMQEDGRLRSRSNKNDESGPAVCQDSSSLEELLI